MCRIYSILSFKIEINTKTIFSRWCSYAPLQWRHKKLDGVWHHQPHVCLLIRLFSHRSKQTSKLSVTGLCAGNSPVTDEFPAQRASNAENVSIWWRHHALSEVGARLQYGVSDYLHSWPAHPHPHPQLGSSHPLLHPQASRPGSSWRDAVRRHSQTHYRHGQIPMR